MQLVHVILESYDVKHTCMTCMLHDPTIRVIISGFKARMRHADMLITQAANSKLETAALT